MNVYDERIYKVYYDRQFTKVENMSLNIRESVTAWVFTVIIQGYGNIFYLLLFLFRDEKEKR